MLEDFGACAVSLLLFCLFDRKGMREGRGDIRIRMIMQNKPQQVHLRALNGLLIEEIMRHEFNPILHTLRDTLCLAGFKDPLVVLDDEIQVRDFFRDSNGDMASASADIYDL